MPIINPLPYILTNGTLADADQVMADFNQIVDQVNANAVSSITGTEWTLSAATPIYASATSFVMAGDVSATFVKGRRLQSLNTAGTIYSTITNVSVSGQTTVTVVNDSGALDVGLSAVYYGILGTPHLSRPQPSAMIISWTQGTAVLVSGTGQVCNTANGFLGGPDFDLFSEVDTVAGTFTPFRSGIYQFAFSSEININGVTFTDGALLCQLSLLQNGHPLRHAYYVRSIQPATTSLGVAAIGYTFAFVTAGQTYALKCNPGTWSAGTPTFNVAELSILGPL